MAGYFIANYTITNQAEYKQYIAAVGPILKAHGAENIVVDRDSVLLEGLAGLAEYIYASPLCVERSLLPRRGLLASGGKRRGPCRRS
jgi:hypothetical protein